MTVHDAIARKLTEALSPEHLEVINESRRHNVPPDSETHFKVVLVSGAFDGKPLVAQHRLVYEALGEELRGGVHALALHTFTPAAWRASASAPDSPLCRGGKAREGA